MQTPAYSCLFFVTWTHHIGIMAVSLVTSDFTCSIGRLSNAIQFALPHNWNTAFLQIFYSDWLIGYVNQLCPSFNNLEWTIIHHSHINLKAQSAAKMVLIFTTLSDLKFLIFNHTTHCSSSICYTQYLQNLQPITYDHKLLNITSLLFCLNNVFCERHVSSNIT